MCEAITVGILTGLMGAVQSIAGYQAQSQAASASEKAYQEQRNLNQEAANRAYQQTQLKMKGEMERASQQAEQGLEVVDTILNYPIMGNTNLLLMVPN
jgi:biopolymer transport protein ExbB/TolQ